MTALAALEQMSPDGRKLLGAMRRNFELLIELEKTDPAAVMAIVETMVATLRSWKPLAASSVSAVPMPIAPERTRVIAQPPIAPIINIERELGRDHRYRVATHDADGERYAIISASDSDEAVVLVMTVEQGDLFESDFAAVLASLRKPAEEASMAPR